MIDLRRTAILLTAHPAQQKWWEPVLLSLERYPGPLILAYDDIDVQPIPGRILAAFTRICVTGYPFGALGPGKGELVCLLRGFTAAAELCIDYCLKLGFDEPVWRWRNIRQLIEKCRIENWQIIDDQTRAIFGEVAVLLQIIQMRDVTQRQKGSAESHWRWAVGTAKIRRLWIRDRKWWEETLGLLHLQGEYAANIGEPNKWSWGIGELWPRE